jgi:hydrogenase-4 component E
VSSIIETCIALLLLNNLMLLGSSRLWNIIRLLVTQGLLIGGVTVFLNHDNLTFRILLLGLGGMTIKSVVLPFIFFRAVKQANIRRQVDPLLGYSASLLCGVLLFALSSWLSAHLPETDNQYAKIGVPAAFFTMFTGFLLIVTRSKAITQVISYLVIENGIYLLGMLFAGQATMLIEFGILLDVIVALFVMGIVVHHINKEFDSIDLSKLTDLRDFEP